MSVLTLRTHNWHVSLFNHFIYLNIYLLPFSQIQDVVVPGMDQGGVSWLLLDVCEKAIEHHGRWRCFTLRITKHQINITKHSNIILGHCVTAIKRHLPSTFIDLCVPFSWAAWIPTRTHMRTHSCLHRNTWREAAGGEGIAHNCGIGAESPKIYACIRADEGAAISWEKCVRADVGAKR